MTGLALPAPRWGAGSALINTARQLGTVLGVAVLTMIYQPGVDLASVRRGWVFIATAAGAAACTPRRYPFGGEPGPLKARTDLIGSR